MSPFLAPVEGQLEITLILHRPAVQRKDDVPILQAAFIGRTTGLGVRHDQSAVARQAQGGGQHRRDVLHEGAYFAPVNVAVFPQLEVNILNDVAGDGEADTLAASRLREDERVDPHQLAFDIHQRAAAVPALMDASV